MKGQVAARNKKKAQYMESTVSMDYKACLCGLQSVVHK